jgi:hypothetical protein
MIEFTGDTKLKELIPFAEPRAPRRRKRKRRRLGEEMVDCVEMFCERLRELNEGRAPLRFGEPTWQERERDRMRLERSRLDAELGWMDLVEREEPDYEANVRLLEGRDEFAWMTDFPRK